MSTDPKTIESYNTNAEAYNAHVNDPNDSIYHSYYEKHAMHAALPDLRGKEVISIGCGSGVDAQYLKDHGASRVVGIDISEGMITVAKREHPDIEFAVMDMEQLGIEDGSFDVAYSSLAIHYLRDWTVALKEAYRILKSEGTYILSAGHPIDEIFDASESEESKMKLIGTVENKTDGTYKILGDYMAADGGGVKRIEGGLATVDVVTYRQTMAKMVEYIVSSGFTIQRLVEPLPLEQMREISPYHYDKLMKIPSFVVWVLRK